MIDADTAKRIAIMRKACTVAGTDLFESLDRAGLIRTPARIAQDRQDVLRDLLGNFDTLRPAEVLAAGLPRGRLGSATPADMHQAVRTVLEVMTKDLGRRDGV